VGALMYMGTRWVGLDLLASPGFFARAWPRLCVGYVADTIGEGPKLRPRLGAGTVLATVAQGEAERAPAVGLGEEYRLSTPNLAGATLVAQERVAPDGVPRCGGPRGESIRTHGGLGRNCLRVIISHVPRGNQLARQWQLLQIIQHPAGIAVDDAARNVDCTVRTIWRDLQVWAEHLDYAAE